MSKIEFNETNSTKNPKSNLTRQTSLHNSKLSKLKYWKKKKPKNQKTKKSWQLKHLKIQVWNWRKNLENWKIEKSRDQSDPEIHVTEYFTLHLQFHLVLK